MLLKDTEKNWKNVAANYHVASELDKAIYAYGRSADKADDGENYVKQAELLSDAYKYKDSVQVFNKALKKGKIDDVGKVHFRKGIAYLELKQFNNSIQSFGEATKYKKWKQRAGQYINYAKTQQSNAAKL